MQYGLPLSTMQRHCNKGGSHLYTFSFFCAPVSGTARSPLLHGCLCRKSENRSVASSSTASAHANVPQLGAKQHHPNIAVVEATEHSAESKGRRRWQQWHWKQRRGGISSSHASLTSTESSASSSKESPRSWPCCPPARPSLRGGPEDAPPQEASASCPPCSRFGTAPWARRTRCCS
jgi:hypothetical protein